MEVDHNCSNNIRLFLYRYIIVFGEYNHSYKSEPIIMRYDYLYSTRSLQLYTIIVSTSTSTL